MKDHIDVSIMHANGQQIYTFGSSSLHEHIQLKQTCLLSGLTVLRRLQSEKRIQNMEAKKSALL